MILNTTSCCMYILPKWSFYSPPTPIIHSSSSRRRRRMCCLSSSNAEHVRTQLDHLHFEADNAIAKANRARSRLIRLSEAAEKLQRQALTFVRTGRENDAKDLLVRKKKVMQALENLKRRIGLLDELSAKLNEAISLKESQLVNSFTIDDVVNKEDLSHEVHIVPPKEESTIVKSGDSQELDLSFIALRNEWLSQVYPDCHAEHSSHTDPIDHEGTLVEGHHGEAKLATDLNKIYSYEDFLEHLDQQLNNVEAELNTFLRFSSMILEGEKSSINLKLQQTGEILEGVCHIRRRIGAFKQSIAEIR